MQYRPVIALLLPKELRLEQNLAFSECSDEELVVMIDLVSGHVEHQSEY